ncbi:hypothetical protein LDENG_00212050 [Lucifuga dentata]|nr:hypothetical protein LDENG_00212050 [Lucifuga dentata]
MASDASPLEEAKARRKRREGDGRRKAAKASEVQTVDIEELTSHGHRALQMGKMEEGLKCFKSALKAAEKLKDSRVLRVCFFNLGASYVEAGRPQKGLDYLQRAQSGPRADRLPDLQFNLAVAHNALGESQQAATYFLQAAQLYRSQGSGASEGDACMEMSRCYARRQDWSQAVQGFLRASESYRMEAMLDSAATALKEAGSHMLQSDRFSQDDIINVLTQCLSMADSITDQSILGELYLEVGVAYCRLRCFQEAVDCFQQALTPAAHQPTLLAAVLHNLGAALNSLGQYRSAVGYHRLATGLYGSLGCRGYQARCFSNLAFACSQLGDEEEAAESFIHALQAFRDTADHCAQVQVCESLAETYLRQKKPQKAIQFYKQALAALTYCQDCSDSVQVRLVERLSAALQVCVQRPCPHRPHPLWSHPDRSSAGQPDRKTDTVRSPGRDFNQQPADRMKVDEEGGAGSKTRRCREEEEEGGGAYQEASDRQEGTNQQPEHTGVVPRTHRSSADCQHSELWSRSVNCHTDSNASLSQEPEAPPTRTDESNATTPPSARWRSRFCTVM